MKFFKILLILFIFTVICCIVTFPSSHGNSNVPAFSSLPSSLLASPPITLKARNKTSNPSNSHIPKFFCCPAESITLFQLRILPQT